MRKRSARRIGIVCVILLSPALVAGTFDARRGGDEPDDSGGAPAAYDSLSFADLACFKYVPPPPAAKDRGSSLPSAVRFLDGRKVSIAGYMIPLTTDGGKISRFYLSRMVFGCCYGDSPALNEVILVVLPPGKGAEYSQMVRAKGVLEVGEEFDSAGYVQSLYRIKGDSAAPVSPGNPKGAERGYTFASILLLLIVGGVLIGFWRAGSRRRPGVLPGSM
jgi:hypothetical protein